MTFTELKCEKDIGFVLSPTRLPWRQTFADRVCKQHGTEARKRSRRRIFLLCDEKLNYDLGREHCLRRKQYQGRVQAFVCNYLRLLSQP